MNRLCSFRLLTAGLAIVLFAGFLQPLFGQVTNRSGHDSTIYISDHIFLPKYPVQTIGQCWAVENADLDGDKDFDLVTIARDADVFCVHLNDGKGNFSPPRQFKTGKNPRNLVLTDINKDGKVDVIVVSMADSKINVHLNNGKGFDDPKSYSTGTFTHDIAVADMNGDGNPDVVTVGNSSRTVNVHLNEGGGKLAKAKSFPVGKLPRRVVLEDVNGDGRPDAVIGSDASFIDVYINTGNGELGNRTKIPAQGSTWGLEVRDINDDGMKDIITCTYSSREMCIYEGKGGGNFGPRRCVRSGNYNFDLVVKDFDLDGDMDVITASTRDNCLNVHINDGSGFFTPGECLKSGDYNTSVTANDFDGDEDLDIVSSSINDNKLNVHRNIPVEMPVPILITYQGKMYDEETGEPLKGIVSFVLDNPERRTISSVLTDKNGHYEVKLPINTGYEIIAGAPDYPKFREKFRLPPRDSVSQELRSTGIEQDIPLKKITGVIVYGLVRDNQTNNPIANAEVQVKNNEMEVIQTIRTDEAGTYEDEVPFGTYVLTATHQRYGESSSSLNIPTSEAGGSIRRDFLLGFDMSKGGGYITGVITDEKTGEPIKGALIRFLTPEGRKIKVTKTNSQGEYEGRLPMGSYMMDVTMKGYFFKVVDFELGEAHKEKEDALQRDIGLSTLAANQSIVLNNIYFDVDKATLRRESVEELKLIKYMLSQNSKLKVEISGHTDSDGSASHNLQLSQERAQAVVDYLTRLGIDPDRLVAKGYGQTRPIASNNTEAGKQKNRRTEFKIISTDFEPVSWDSDPSWNNEQAYDSWEGEDWGDADWESEGSGGGDDWGDWGDDGGYVD